MNRFNVEVGVTDVTGGPQFGTRDDRSDGTDLRSLRFGADEVLSRLYFAVRDVWWRTVLLSIVDSRRTGTPTGFRLEVDAVSGWASHPVEVALRYEADGARLTATATVSANGPFAYGRIGFCLLLPVDAYRDRHATSWLDGARTPVEFPAGIITRDDIDNAALRFHRPFDRLTTTLASGADVEFRFEGERFELEDQRNWTDASYKIYSEPPVGGLPAFTVAGGRFSQTVRVAVSPSPATSRARPPAGPDETITVGGPIAPVPPVTLYRGRISPTSYRPVAGYYELNTQPVGALRQAGFDSVELGVNGSVHAADDDSVQEATATHGTLVAQARARHPGLALRLAPVTFGDAAGDWRDPAGRYVAEPAPGSTTDRQRGTFGAAWVVASAARALPAGPASVHYFDTTLPPDCPAARAVDRLGALAGGELLAVTAPRGVAALAARAPGRRAVTLAVANPGPDPARIRLPDGRTAVLRPFTSAFYELRAPAPPGPRDPARETARDLARDPARDMGARRIDSRTGSEPHRDASPDRAVT